MATQGQKPIGKVAWRLRSFHTCKLLTDPSSSISVFVAEKFQRKPNEQTNKQKSCAETALPARPSFGYFKISVTGSAQSILVLEVAAKAVHDDGVLPAEVLDVLRVRGVAISAWTARAARFPSRWRQAEKLGAVSIRQAALANVLI
eukprot:scaffold2324_cov266-Pinguiococcus_pyrenoidosus.AAC.17